MNLRRILALMLSVLMLVSALPLNAIAEEMMIANLEELIATIETPVAEEEIPEQTEEETEASAPTEEEAEVQTMQTLSMEDVAALLAEEEGAVEETDMPEVYAEGAGEWNSDYSVLTFHGVPTADDLKAAVNAWGAAANPSVSTTITYKTLFGNGSTNMDIAWQVADALKDAAITITPDSISHGQKYNATAKFEYSIEILGQSGSGTPTYTHTFTLNIYDELTVSTTKGETTTTTTKVYRDGNAVTVDVDEYEGFDVTVTGAELIDGKWVVAANGLTDDATVSIVYSEIAAPKSNVSLVVENDKYGSAKLSAEGELDEKTKVEITVTPATPAEGVTNLSYTYEIKVEGAELAADNTFVVGEDDVVVTVTFVENALTTDGSADIEYALIADTDALEAAIVKLLNVKYNGEAVTSGATVEYRGEIAYEDRGLVGDWFALDVEEPKYNLSLGNLGSIPIPVPEFAADGVGSTEKIRITYKGLVVEAVITLVDTRTAPETDVNATDILISGYAPAGWNVSIAADAKNLAAQVAGKVSIIDENGEAAQHDGAATVYFLVVNAETGEETWYECNEINLGIYGASVPLNGTATFYVAFAESNNYAATETEPFDVNIVDSRKEVAISITENTFYDDTWKETDEEIAAGADEKTLETAAVTEAVVVDPEVEFTVSLGEIMNVEDSTDKISKATITVADSAEIIGASKEFEVTFAINEYTVTWVANGGYWVDDEGNEIAKIAQVLKYGEEIAQPAQPNNSDKELKFVEWSGYDAEKNATVTGNVTFTAVWGLANDKNNNGVADSKETGHILLNVNNASYGKVSLSEDFVGTIITYDENSGLYEVLFDSTKEGENVITVNAEANAQTENAYYYVASANETVNVAANTTVLAKVSFGADILAPQNGTAYVNFYSAETKADGLKGKILDAARVEADTVELYFSAKEIAKLIADYIKIADVDTILNYFPDLDAYLNIEGESYPFTIFGQSFDIPISAELVQALITNGYTGTFLFTKNTEKYTLTAKSEITFEETRGKATLLTPTFSEINYTSKTEIDEKLAEVKAAAIAQLNEAEQANVKAALTGVLPTEKDENGNAGDGKMTYTITYPEDAAYLKTEVVIPFTAVYVPTDAYLRVFTSDDYTVKVNSAVVDDEGMAEINLPVSTVEATTTQIIEITPAAGKAIADVVVVKVEDSNTDSSFNEEDVDNNLAVVTYDNQVATATFAMERPTETVLYILKVQVKNVGFDFKGMVEDGDLTDDNPDNDARVYNYKYGETDEKGNLIMANAKDVYNAVVESPALTGAEGEEFTVEYLARADEKVVFELEDMTIDLFGIPVTLPLSGREYSVDLGPSWLAVDEQPLDVKTPNEVAMDAIKDILAAPEQIMDMVELSDVLNAIRTGDLSGISNEVIELVKKTVEDELKYFGAHSFGENGKEIIRVSYENNQFAIGKTETDVQVVDTRYAASITATAATVTYGSFTEADVKAALGVTLDAEGDATAADVECTYLGGEITKLNASETPYTITLKFAGDEDNKPCTAAAQLTVKKAPLTIDYDSQVVTYGTDYDFSIKTSPAADLNTGKAINIMEFILGVDVSDLDVTPETNPIDGLVPEMWVELPQSIMDLLKTVGLEFSFDKDGYSLSKFIDIMTSLADQLSSIDGLGIDLSGIDTLLEELEKIMAQLGVDDLRIYIEQGMPTDIGVYIAGAISVDTNYETAYTADYLLIVPQITEAELNWKYEDENFIVTLPLAKEGDYLKAESTPETYNNAIEYLYIGYDINGEFRLIKDTTAFEAKDCGAYIQIAYLLQWDNETTYAMPIVRPVVIVPELYTVTFEDANANNIRVFEFDNTPKAMKVSAVDQSGNDVTSKVTTRYIGMKTNTDIFNETYAPTNAGVYAVVSSVIDRDAAGEIIGAGMAVGALVITPTTSTIEVIPDGNNVRLQSKLPEGGLAVKNLVDADSTVKTITPDTTVITASLNIEKGIDLRNINGNLNIDLPEWVYREGFLPESLKDGVTVAELIAALQAANGNAVAPMALEDDIANTAASLKDALAQIDVSEIAAAVENALKQAGSDIDFTGVKAEIENAIEQLKTNADIADMAGAVQDAIEKLGQEVEFTTALEAVKAALEQLDVNVTASNISDFVQTVVDRLGEEINIADVETYIQDALDQLAGYIDAAGLEASIKDALAQLESNPEYAEIAESIKAALEEMGNKAETGITDITGFVQDILNQLETEIDVAEIEAAVKAALSEMDFGPDFDAIANAIESVLAKLDMRAEFADMANEMLEILAQIPSNLSVTFENDQKLSKIGAYMIIGIVTDSDHIPSADYDYLVITSAIADINFKDDTNDNNLFYRVYNDKNQAVEVESVDIIPEGAAVGKKELVKITYTGIESAIDFDSKGVVNTPFYHSTVAPIQTGTYLVTATYYDEVNGAVNAIGIEMGVLVIAPADTDIAVNGGTFTGNVLVDSIIDVEAGVQNTVITTGVEVNEKTLKAFADAFAAGKIPTIKDVYGNVAYLNVDLPDWMDTALKLAGIDPATDKITVADLQGKVEVIADAYVKAKNIAREKTDGEAMIVAGALAMIAGVTPEEVLAQLKKVDDSFEAALAELINVLDQYESTLEVTAVENFEMKAEGLYLVTAMVTDTDYKFAIDSDLVIATNITGAKVQINSYETDYDGSVKPAMVYVDGKLVSADDANLTVRYTGVQTDGKAIVNTTEAPKYAGVYLAVAQYAVDNGEALETYGAALGMIVIEPKDLKLNVPATAYTYDGQQKAPVATIDCCNEPAGYKTVLTAVKVDETTVNLNVPAEFVDQLMGIINAVDETYDAAKELPAEAKNLIKALGAAAGLTMEDVDDMKQLVKDLTNDNIQVVDYKVVVDAMNELVALADALRTNAAELVNTYAPKAEDLADLVLSDEDLALLEHYADVVVTKLAAYSQNVVDQITEMAAFINREIAEGVTKVTINENPSKVGTYPVVALAYMNSDHYMAVAANDEGLVIKPIEVTIKVANASKTYGEDDPAAFAYTVEPASAAADLGITVKRVAGENAGSYTIYATYNKNDKYDVTVETGTFTINQKAITKADVKAAPLAFTYNGKVQGPTVTVTPGITYEVTGKATATNAGKYTLIVTGTGNYTGTVTFDWTIEKKNDPIIPPAEKTKVTITVANKTKTYGKADPEFTYTVSPAYAAAALNIKTSRVAGSDVGTYMINATYTENALYEVDVKTGTLTITKATATVAVDTAHKTYGTVNPEFTSTVTGLVGTDELNISYTCDAEQYSSIGKYDIIANVAAHKNYNVVLVNNGVGTLFIEAKPINVTVEDASKIYSEADPAIFNYEVSGVLNDDVVTVTVAREEGEDAGEYGFTAISSNPNYMVKNVYGTFTINPKPVAVVINNATKEYGEADPVFDYEVRGLVNGDTELDVTITREPGEEVGEYAFTAVSENPNYTVVTVRPEVFTILDSAKIKITSVSLSLLERIYMNFYGTIEGYEDVDATKNGGMLIWHKEIAEEDATIENINLEENPADVIEGLKYNSNNGMYYQQSKGIIARKYADEMYVRYYLKLEDGSYAYSQLVEYSVQKCAQSIYKNNKSENYHDVASSLLQYGTAAQHYFDYNLDDLANAVAEKEIAFQKEWLDAAVQAPENRIGFEASENVKNAGVSLSLVDALCMNLYYSFEGEFESAELLTWDDANSIMTAATADHITKLNKSANGNYWGQTEGIIAREYGKTRYYAARFTDAEGNEFYSKVMALSPEVLANFALYEGGSTNPEMHKVCETLITYGECAKIYLANR